MDTTFKITRSSRKAMLHFLETLSLDQLNAVPAGFNNNVIWNIGHCIVVQQMLVYKLSGLPMMIPDAMVDSYKRGTRPERDVNQKEANQIKTLLFSTLDKTEKDFAANVFQDYHVFTTMSGFELRDAITAIEFNNYHEGVHTGVMMSLQKFI